MFESISTREGLDHEVWSWIIMKFLTREALLACHVLILAEVEDHELVNAAAEVMSKECRAVGPQGQKRYNTICICNMQYRCPFHALSILKISRGSGGGSKEPTFWPLNISCGEGSTTVRLNSH